MTKFLLGSIVVKKIIKFGEILMNKIYMKVANNNDNSLTRNTELYRGKILIILNA